MLHQRDNETQNRGLPEQINYETGEIVAISYRRSAQLGELFTALAKAQAEFAAAEKSGTAQYGGYPTLNSVLEATKDGRHHNNLALIQIPSNGDGNVITVTTILGHASGQWIESTLGMIPVKYDAQGAGSVITYLRRYAAGAILGVAPEDDDGEAAVQAPRKAPDARRPQQVRPAPLSQERAHAPSHAAGNGTDIPEAIRQFLERGSYHIAVKAAGGWPRCASWFEKTYLSIAAHCGDTAAHAKLQADNAANLADFRKAVKPDVYADFVLKVEANERRVATQPVIVP